jgi:FkbM family methyltransferase
MLMVTASNICFLNPLPLLKNLFMLDHLSKPASVYLELLGKEQALKLLALFAEIEAGKYAKEEVHELRLNGFPHPVFLRAIRADMQSFINTFIDPYLEKKPYLPSAETVIDAGANIGYTAILFASWWPESTIISIEPDQENYELVLRNICCYPNIYAVPGALWNKEATLSIEAGQEDGFVVRESVTEETKAENTTRGFSIPQLLKRFGKNHIDFLKLNVEGSEKEIFSEGYEDWPPQIRAMLVELHDGKNPGCSAAVFSAVQNRDFAVAETAPYGILFVKEPAYRAWYAKWYKESIYQPNINKERFPKFYLEGEE